MGSDRARHSLFWSRTSLRLLVLLCTALPLSWLPALVSAPQMTVMDETWTVFRRYSRFREMHKALRLKHPEVGDVLQTFSSRLLLMVPCCFLPSSPCSLLQLLTLEFPPKMLFGNRDERLVAERRGLLEVRIRVTSCSIS